MSTAPTPDDDGEIEEKVKVRATRQARLTEENPPQIWIVLNEAVIRRDFKGAVPVA